MKQILKTLAICGIALSMTICGCHKNASDDNQPSGTEPAVQSDSMGSDQAKPAENKDESANEPQTLDEKTAENKDDKADEVQGDKEKKEVVDKSISSSEKGVNIDVHYPELGNEAINAFLADKAQKDAKSGKKELEKLRENLTETDQNPDYDWGMKYEVIRSTPDSADILFTHTEYTGGAHPMAAIEAVMLDESGKVIDPWSLFENPDEELIKISEEARKQLREKLSNYEDVDSMIRNGTEPKRENFSQMVRTNDGVRIYFNPYDLAPWSEGILYVDYPLK